MSREESQAGYTPLSIPPLWYFDIPLPPHTSARKGLMTLDTAIVQHGLYNPAHASSPDSFTLSQVCGFYHAELRVMRGDALIAAKQTTQGLLTLAPLLVSIVALARKKDSGAAIRKADRINPGMVARAVSSACLGALSLADFSSALLWVQSGLAVVSAAYYPDLLWTKLRILSAAAQSHAAQSHANGDGDGDANPDDNADNNSRAHEFLSTTQEYLDLVPGDSRAWALLASFASTHAESLSQASQGERPPSPEQWA